MQSYLVPARSQLNLEMTAARACLCPTYTVLISTDPHIVLSNHELQSTLYRTKCICNIRFLQTKHNFILPNYGYAFLCVPKESIICCICSISSLRTKSQIHINTTDRRCTRTGILPGEIKGSRIQ